MNLFLKHLKEIKLILGTIFLISTMVSVSVVFFKEPKSDLGIYFNASHYYFPNEFASRLNDQWRMFSSEHSSSDLNEFLDGKSQNQQYIDSAIIDLFKKYLDEKSKQLYAVPFENNPRIFNSVIHIQIINNGKKTAHKINIKLPDKGFIESNANTNSGTSIPASIDNELTIPEILGSKHIDVWVYFEERIDELDLSKLTIVHDDVLVDISKHHHFSGLNEFFAKYWFFIFAPLIIYLVTSIYYIKKNIPKQ